jgi:hypothetical protein
MTACTRPHRTPWPHRPHRPESAHGVARAGREGMPEEGTA